MRICNPWARLARLRRAIVCAGLCFMLWLSSTESGRGQGTLTYTVSSVLQTGSDTPLTTATQRLETGSLQPAGRLEFAFGFATEELPVPNVFFDSATITLQNAGGTVTAVYLTVDANSLTWVPATPGAVALSLED